MGLRIKILSGFLLLSLMLLIAGLWSINELKSIGSSVQRILDENYKSIYAAKLMKEALEREDSAVLLLMLGKWEEGRQILKSADSMFVHNFSFAKKNVTIPGEQEQLNTIENKYRSYKKLWERPIVDTNREGNLQWYFQQLHDSFMDVKEAVNDLIDLNDKMMYQTASELKNRSNRAIMPGIIAILAALIFTFIFNYLVNYYMVSPIIRMTERVKKFIEKRTPFDIQVETNDEIAHLAEAIYNLCESVRSREEEQ